MVRVITLDEPFLPVQNDLGEGCLWDSKTGLLHWVDIFRSTIHTLDPKTMNHSVDDYSECDTVITSLIQLKDGSGFIGSHLKHLAFFPNPTKPIRPFPKSTTTKRTSQPLEGSKAFEIPAKYFEAGEDGVHRFNDGAADAKGRLWIGTMGHKEAGYNGQLFRYDPDGHVELVYEGIGVSNGIGFSPDNKIMYYIDSPTRVIYQMDFDLESGRVSNRRTLLDSSSFDDGVFDGLCMDAEGAVWAARWGDNRVVRVLPDGKVDLEIRIPGARCITCCVFGGDDMEDLFIVTASCKDKPELNEKYPQGGDLFKIRVDGIKGVERYKFGN
ncbi:hypothetical protein FFLO_06452 [Filobasidium floriforme]|uniref:SMP-30/Gluconolactonase/LRE-like region domain-containing protein n=1 Tax=Filobasidium floriforme TaxID=5210 RepID=A0A8K0JEX1_9TREE|nr:hypothetical protein FFLO_06452 [Filobasidium floriforme]